MRIELDEATHTYTVDGKVVPSVTQILDPLNDFDGVPPDILERARQFGTAVHKMVELWERNVLDVEDLDPALKPYLAQYQAAMQHTGWGVIASEARVAHPALGYAGTLDLVVRDRKDRPAVVDVKSGQIPLTVGAQVAAYASAYTTMLGDSAKYRRYCLQITPNAFKVVELTEASDWSLFVSALNVHKFKEKHHGPARIAA